MQPTGRWPGIALPFSESVSGTLEPKRDDDKLKSSIFLIVMTRLGERVMLPEFGTDIPLKAFEQSDDALAAEIKESIEDAVKTWDDRINVLRITVTQDLNDVKVNILFQDATDPTPEYVQELQFDIDTLSDQA